MSPYLSFQRFLEASGGKPETRWFTGILIWPVQEHTSPSRSSIRFGRRTAWRVRWSTGCWWRIVAWWVVLHTVDGPGKSDKPPIWDGWKPYKFYKCWNKHGWLASINCKSSQPSTVVYRGFQWCTRPTSCEVFFYTFCMLIFVSLITQKLGWRSRVHDCQIPCFFFPLMGGSESKCWDQNLWISLTCKLALLQCRICIRALKIIEN